MSDSNDTLNLPASEETPGTQVQAGGEDGSGSVQGAASPETPAKKLYAGKYESVEAMEQALLEAQKLIGRKTIDPAEAAKAMGLAGKLAETPNQPALTRAEGREVAQQAGGDALEQWFTQTAKQFGTAAAIKAMFDHFGKTALAEMLSPVNQELSRMQTSANQTRLESAQTRLESAVNHLAREYADFADHTAAMGKILETRPTWKRQIESAETEAEKRELLEMVYFRAKNTVVKNAETAAKTAGAVDSKQREQMKQSSVTGGGGSGKRSDTPRNPADDFEEAAVEYERGRNLFG